MIAWRFPHPEGPDERIIADFNYVAIGWLLEEQHLLLGV